MTQADNQPGEAVRLDKWLWAARFFKTRRLAVEAINGGKVQVDGLRTKPGKTVHPGTRLSVHKGGLAWELEVKAVAKQRRPAAEAALLYEESDESRLRRQELVRDRPERGGPTGSTHGRPSKRDRRMIERLTRGSDT